MITYKTAPETHYVYLDGKCVGTITLTPGGYQYRPKGAKTGGDFYPTLALCKASLEDTPEGENIAEDMMQRIDSCRVG